MGAPIGHTCPTINEVQHRMQEIADISIECQSTIEQLRSDNDTLRTWGEEMESERDEYEHQLEEVTTERDDLAQELEKAKETIMELQSKISETAL